MPAIFSAIVVIALTIFDFFIGGYALSVQANYPNSIGAWIFIAVHLLLIAVFILIHQLFLKSKSESHRGAVIVYKVFFFFALIVFVFYSYAILTLVIQ